MNLCFNAELAPCVEVAMNGKELFRGNAKDQFSVTCPNRKGKLTIKMYNKDPCTQPAGKDTHIKLTQIEFDELVLDETEIYKLYNPQVRGDKTLYLGFNAPDCLELTIEHPHNIIIKRLALIK